MVETILLLTLILGLVVFLLYVSINGTKFSKRTSLLTIAISLTIISLLCVYTGTDKIKSDITRVIHNSKPKQADDVYALLFKKPIDSCVTIINFNDQIIPRIDCCIWMELKLCPMELQRILSLKGYQRLRLKKSDSLSFLASFKDRPIWWTPQILGDSLTEYTIEFNQDNRQTIFFGYDSSHIYLCDQAL